MSELVIGVLLILGLFTGAAAFAGLAVNLVYMFTGSAGVNPAYAIVAVLLTLAWRNAGYLGLDRLVLPMIRNGSPRLPHGHACDVTANSTDAGARADTRELTRRSARFTDPERQLMMTKDSDL